MGSIRRKPFAGARAPQSGHDFVICFPMLTTRRKTASSERMEIEDVEGVIALPGAVEIASNATRKRLDYRDLLYQAAALVRAACSWLPNSGATVTSNDIVNGKLGSRAVQEGAELLGIAASDCTVIEDAPAGIRAGKRRVQAVLRCKPRARGFFAAGRGRLDREGLRLGASGRSNRNGDMSLLLSGTA